MENISSPAKTREILVKHGFHLSKGLGQNFLVDGNFLRKIVEGASLKKEDGVIEIGPGIGTLTRELAKEAGWVVAIELDRRLLPILEETMEEFTNFSLIEGDVLKIDWQDIVLKFPQTLRNSIKVVANLPYYITTPILTSLLEGDLPWRTIVIMVQKEVAQRIVAPPGDKSYGSFSVLTKFYAKGEIIAVVPPKVFIPPPKVDSAVVKLIRRDKPPVSLADENFFFKVVRAAFAQRRKTLLNALDNSLGMKVGRDRIGEALMNSNVDGRRRAETLSIEEFGEIANNLYRIVRE